MNMKKTLIGLVLGLVLGNQAFAVGDAATITPNYDNSYTYDVPPQGSYNQQAQQGFISKNVKNARQQGYKGVDELTNEEKAHLQEQATNARQMAIQVEPYHEANPVINNKKDKMWIKNWAYILEDKGISQERTYFEASRLNKEDFEEWANGIYNAY